MQWRSGLYCADQWKIFTLKKTVVIKYILDHIKPKWHICLEGVWGASVVWSFCTCRTRQKKTANPELYSCSSLCLRLHSLVFWIFRNIIKESCSLSFCSDQRLTLSTMALSYVCESFAALRVCRMLLKWYSSLLLSSVDFRYFEFRLT